MSADALGIAIAFTGMVLYSSTMVITRVATQRVDSDLGLLVVMEVTVAAAALAVAAGWLLGFGPHSIAWWPFAAFALSGVFSTFLGRWLLFESVARLGAARASAFQTSSPLFSALFGWALLGDRPTPLGLLAMLVTLSGLALLADRSAQTAEGAQATAEKPGRLLYIGLSSAAAYAMGNICRAWAVRGWNEPLMGLLLGAATGWALHLIVSRGKTASLRHRLRGADRWAVSLFVAVALLGLVAQVCIIGAMRLLPVAEVALIVSSMPLLVFPATWLLRGGETITARALVGLTLALIGILALVARPVLAPSAGA